MVLVVLLLAEHVSGNEDIPEGIQVIGWLVCWCFWLVPLLLCEAVRALQMTSFCNELWGKQSVFEL